MKTIIFLSGKQFVLVRNFHVQTDVTRHCGRDLLGSQIRVTTGGHRKLDPPVVTGICDRNNS